MSVLWSAATAAAADAYTMQTLGVPSPVLMERASLCVATEVEAVCPPEAPVVCLVGPGNNGGDALAVARILAHRGYRAHAWLVTERRNEAAEAQRVLAERAGVQLHAGPQALPEVAVWVDGLLGTGSRGAPRGAVADAIAWLQDRGGPVVAIDVPSGVDVDDGTGEAVRADVTVTLVRSKLGLHVTPGRDAAGRVVVADIGIAPAPGSEPAAGLLDAEAVAALLSTIVRRPAAHKGQRGHVAVVGGSPNTPGAAVLAGTAAMRAGAGLCTVVGEVDLAGRPELMRAPWRQPMLPSADVLVVGPGLTEVPDPDALAALYRDDPRPAVWDASALDHVPLDGAAAGPRVLTPHPGEAARLLSRAGAPWTSATVQRGRVEACDALWQATEAVVVLKGAGTLVRGPGGLSVAVEGTEALATAGSGDVLAGCVGALLARGLDATAAAGAGVSLHGRAGLVAAEVRGVPLALDIADALPRALQALAAAEPGPAEPRRVVG